jgi:peptide/nickel transport system permease protein
MDAWRDSQGLNEPIVKQYLSFLGGALHGDLGESYYSHTAVTEGSQVVFLQRLSLRLLRSSLPLLSASF